MTTSDSADRMNLFSLMQQHPVLLPAGVGPDSRTLEKLGPEMAQAFHGLLDE
jgi:hypothetical protein